MSTSNSQTNNPLSSTAGAALRTELRNFAVQHLPAPTVPSRFVVLPELPKLANGKVDRKQLAAPPEEVAQDRTYTPPETPEEMKVASIWADLLGANRVGLHDDFLELGGNSLVAVQMAARVRAEMGISINLRRFFENPTVAQVAKLLDSDGGRTVQAGQRNARSVSPEELVAEAQLPADITPPPGAVASAPPYSSIFVTGGTGYTGAYLVRELIDRSKAQVMVLIRADDERHALRRIRGTMAQFGVWRDGDERRIVPLVGDLARPYFGLERSVYRRLAATAEVIIHNGALSSYALSYRRLKPVNVLGTLEVLRLACRGRVKPVHYVSSLAVYPGVMGSPRWMEVEVTEPRDVIGGYRQTKWVGDSMASQAGRRGLPVNIYRPGLITGAQDSGACSTDTFLNASVKGCVQLGSTFPFDAPLEATPVDFFAAAVAHIALNGERHGKIFNMPGARTMEPPELFERVEEFGYPLRHLTYPEWYKELVAAVDRGEENELVRFLPLFGPERPSDEMGHQGGRPIYDVTQLEAALAGSGIVCAQPDRALWERYLSWFVSSGYLPPPPARRSA
jgi:thioester reductase-like protein